MHDTARPNPSPAASRPGDLRSILIADRTLDDIGLLLDGLKSGIELRLLGPDEDPVGAFRDALGEADVKAVHLVGHGAPGRMSFPSGILDAASLEAVPTGTGLGVEVVLYGCRTGAGTSGQTLLDAIARLTAAPVRAATGRVGCTAKGGSWRLNARRGTPVDGLAFSQAALDRYPRLLDENPYATVNSLSTTDTSPTLTGTVGNQGGLALYVSVDGTLYRVTPTGSTWSLDLPEGSIGPDRRHLDLVVSLLDEEDGIWLETDRQTLTYDDTPGYVTLTSPVLTRNTTPTLSGRVEYNSTLTVTVGGATYSLFVPGGPFSPDQYWSLNLGSAVPSSGTLSLDTNGPNTITFYATDAAGNTTTPQTATLTIDSVAPEVAITSAATTNSATPIISGTAEADAAVTVTAAGATYTTNAIDGVWSIDLSTATPSSGSLTLDTNGANAVSVTATDAVGNSASVNQTLLIDRIAPTVAIGSASLTNAATPVISGSAEAGAMISLSVGGATYAITAADGTWSIDLGTAVPTAGTLALNTNGPNAVSVTATDAAGNTASDAQTLTIDRTPPSLAITSAMLTNDTDPVIAGTAEAGRTVTVSVGGAIYTALAGNGTWSIDLATATPASGALMLDLDGENGVTATIVDAAGNTASVSQTLTIDRTPPTVSIGTIAGDDRINDNEDDSPVVLSGSSAGVATGQVVTVRVGSFQTTGTVDEGGSWTAFLSPTELAGLAEGPLMVTADVNDAAGNAASQANRSVLYDRTGPATTVSGIALSHDTGILADDFVTASVLQTVTATLSAPLQTGEALYGSADNGENWSDITTSVTETAINWTGVTLSGSNSLRFQVVDAAGNRGLVASRDYRLDSSAPNLDSSASQMSGTSLTLSFSEAVVLPDGPAARTAGLSVMVAGQSVAITDVIGSGSPTLTLSLGASVAAGQQVVVLYDPAAANSGLTDIAGNEAAAISATLSAASPPPPLSQSPDSSSDGTAIGEVPVTTVTTTNADGSTTQTISTPTGTTGVAPAITLVSSGDASLTARLPAGLTLQVTGSATPQTTDAALASLKRQLESLAAGSEDGLAGESSGFLKSLPTTGALLVQTLTPTLTGSTLPDAPLVISGSGTSGSTPTALLIDTRRMPSGTVLQLQNIEFAAVIGAVTVTGGDGSQTVWGDSANQTLILGADDDTLHGGGGDDFVGSKTGNDLLYGDDGNDTVQGGEEQDRLFGNSGSDVLFGNTGADTLYGGQGTDRLYGGQDDDRLSGDLGSDTLAGDQGNDVLFGGLADANGDLLFGNRGSDVLYGNAGADTLHGGQEADTLFGGLDDDLLFGDVGDDVLSGDHGADTLFGGAGADLFVITSGSGKDVITDFAVGEGDRIRLVEGQGYSLRSDGAGNAVIVFSSDDELVLRGITQAQVQAGWFVSG